MLKLPAFARALVGASAPESAAAVARAETEWENRRAAARHQTAITGRLRLPASEHECRIVDLSAGGMQVVAPDAAVSVGQQVAVATRNFPALVGIVCWSREGSFGVQFLKPMPPRLIPKVGRLKRRVRRPRSPRVPLSLPAVVFFDGTRRRVTVGNISVGGLMITAVQDGSKPIRAGQALMIEFSELLPIGGHVRWAADNRCGIMFARLLPVAAAAEIGRLAGLGSAWLQEVKRAHAELSAAERAIISASAPDA